MIFKVILLLWIILYAMGTVFREPLNFTFMIILDWIMMIINIYQDLVIGTHYNIMISLMENFVHL